MIYGYDNLLDDIRDFNKVFSIGRSVFGREIFAIKVGDGTPHAIIHASIHARESICSNVTLEYVRHYVGPSIVFVPMLNPDGVMLNKFGIDSAKKRYQKFLLDVNKSDNFLLWKANGRGVDLNVNFDADFGTGFTNVQKPAPENYIGQYPFSEPETKAIRDFTLENKIVASISLHSKGEIIYYGYKNCKNYIKYVNILSNDIGYPISTSSGSAGGYKDWFLLNNLGFAVTVELGCDKLAHPIDTKFAKDIFKKTQKLPYFLGQVAEELWTRNL